MSANENQEPLGVASDASLADADNETRIRVRSRREADQRAENLRLDYQECVHVFRMLVDVRFKLLAFVPAVSGAAIALVTRAVPDWQVRLGLSLVGLAVTIGIVFYDQRNSQLYNEAIGRAQFLEKALELPFADDDTTRGLFNSRALPRRLLGLVRMTHDRALALIYGSVIGAWVSAEYDHKLPALVQAFFVPRETSVSRQ